MWWCSFILQKGYVWVMCIFVGHLNILYLCGILKD